MLVDLCNTPKHDSGEQCKEIEIFKGIDIGKGKIETPDQEE